uniref:Uncharacterized protein n=1 Tax=Siphoviridae sp. ctLeh52 TaxID=2827849 RepID=A0A8S5RWX8_9CAUD|nr:MAG TPA: hypothetical protein [Siphoviridae sp. ctLeh52]DAG26598.1 MAG TPA: hypothetical protein [Bacteriophage sp.]
MDTKQHLRHFFNSSGILPPTLYPVANRKHRWVRICTSHSLHSCERLPAYYRPTIIKPYTLTIPILSPHTPIL